MRRQSPYMGFQLWIDQSELQNSSQILTRQTPHFPRFRAKFNSGTLSEISSTAAVT